MKEIIILNLFIIFSFKCDSFHFLPLQNIAISTIVRCNANITCQLQTALLQKDEHFLAT